MVFNAAAILNEQRFLEKCAYIFSLPSSSLILSPHYFIPLFADGWGFSQLGNHPIGEGPGALKYQIIGTLHAATYMRVPLIAINLVVILLKLIIG